MCSSDLKNANSKNVTKNDSVKIEINSGEQIPKNLIPGISDISIIKKDANNVPLYVTANTDKWNSTPSAYKLTDKITKNVEFVIQYERLINGIEYTIEFVDKATGAQLTAPIFGWGSEGQIIKSQMELQTEPKQIANYAYKGAASQEFKLERNGKNIFTYQYLTTLGGTETRTITEYYDGGITYEDSTNIIYQQANVVGRSPSTTSNNPSKNETKPLDTNTDVEEESSIDGNDQDKMNEGDNIEEDNKQESQTDGEVEEKETIIVDEPEAPLSPGIQEKVTVLPIISCIFIGIVIILAIVWFIVRGKKKVEEDSEKESD